MYPITENYFVGGGEFRYKRFIYENGAVRLQFDVPPGQFANISGFYIVVNFDPAGEIILNGSVE